GIYTLSGKLVGIVLPINYFGNHLDSQGKTIDTELAVQNFRHAGTMLCNIWCLEPSLEKSVVEFVMISNSAEIDDFGTLPLEQNRQDFTSGEDFRDYVSDLE
ncbi:7050_t:CDS:2, partial [Gigaspora margarita]